MLRLRPAANTQDTAGSIVSATIANQPGRVNHVRISRKASFRPCRYTSNAEEQFAAAAELGYDLRRAVLDRVFNAYDSC